MNQEILKEILHYSEETGQFIWNADRTANKISGNVAGTINKGYVRIKINNKIYLAHRLAWLYVYGEPPSSMLDHINQNKSDNRISNLRISNHRHNAYNRHDNAKCPGVTFNKQKRKWVALIRINKVKKYLGGYTDWFEAVCSRKSAENKLLSIPDS